jgi:hypothetical protein
MDMQRGVKRPNVVLFRRLRRDLSSWRAMGGDRFPTVGSHISSAVDLNGKHGESRETQTRLLLAGYDNLTVHVPLCSSRIGLPTATATFLARGLRLRLRFPYSLS